MAQAVRGAMKVEMHQRFKVTAASALVKTLNHALIETCHANKRRKGSTFDSLFP